MNINQLSAISAGGLSAGDLLAVWSQANGDTRKVSFTLIGTLLNAGTQIPTKQYANPAASGFTVTLMDNGDNKWLILAPAAGYAAGTIVLPALVNSVEGQELLVNCSQAITTLTINGNGSTVVGAPTTLTANSCFRLRYDADAHVWYNIV